MRGATEGGIFLKAYGLTLRMLSQTPDVTKSLIHHYIKSKTKHKDEGRGVTYTYNF